MNYLLFKTITSKKRQFLQKFISSLPNPNLMYASIGDRQATLENILTDPHVTSCVQSRKSGVLSQTWEVQPANSLTNGINELINQVFRELDVFKIITELLNAPLYGFVISEIVWKLSTWQNRKIILPALIQSKPNKLFFFDSNDIPRYRNPETHKDEILLPYKFLIIQHEPTFDNPYGNAVLSKCLWPVVFKKTFVTFWTNFAEKFGMPHFIGKTDNIATTKDFEEFEKLLENLIQDGSAVIPSTDSIEILNATTANSASIFQDFINFCNTEISKAILSQTLTTELGNVGSYAAANVHASIREDVVKSDKLLVEKALNKLIRWIVDLNFGKQSEYPKFIIYQEEDVDKPLAETVQILKQAGIRVLEPFIIRRMGLQKNEFELIEDRASASMPSIDFAEFHNSIPEDQTIIDNEVAQTVEEKTGIDDIVS
ncbi:MAG: DUF935 family protein, partial [Candidatus Kapaibacteriota bacterium]